MNTVEVKKRKYKDYRKSGLDTATINRNCLRCEEPFKAIGVPGGVRFIRVCPACKRRSDANNRVANKSECF